MVLEMDKGFLCRVYRNVAMFSVVIQVYIVVYELADKEDRH
jgi:hypothetical protein